MTIRLPQLIGIDRARRMTFTGDFISAETAREWGLVIEVVPHEDLLDRAREMAGTIAAIPAESIRANRRLYDQIGELSGREAWVVESRASRDWMAQKFDQQRLATERSSIIARGRSQAQESGTEA
jgi:enoyl-CoA hydratase